MCCIYHLHFVWYRPRILVYVLNIPRAGVYMGNIHRTQTEAEGRGLCDGVYFPYTLREGYIQLIPISKPTDQSPNPLRMSPLCATCATVSEYHFPHRCMQARVREGSMHVDLAQSLPCQKSSTWILRNHVAQSCCAIIATYKRSMCLQHPRQILLFFDDGGTCFQTCVFCLFQ